MIKPPRPSTLIKGKRIVSSILSRRAIAENKNASDLSTVLYSMRSASEVYQINTKAAENALKSISSDNSNIQILENKVSPLGLQILFTITDDQYGELLYDGILYYFTKRLSEAKTIEEALDQKAPFEEYTKLVEILRESLGDVLQNGYHRKFKFFMCNTGNLDTGRYNMYYKGEVVDERFVRLDMATNRAFTGKKHDVFYGIPKVILETISSEILMENSVMEIIREVINMNNDNNENITRLDKIAKDLSVKKFPIKHWDNIKTILARIVDVKNRMNNYSTLLAAANYSLEYEIGYRIPNNSNWIASNIGAFKIVPCIADTNYQKITINSTGIGINPADKHVPYYYRSVVRLEKEVLALQTSATSMQDLCYKMLEMIQTQYTLIAAVSSFIALFISMIAILISIIA